METPYDGGTKYRSNGSGHMAKMTALPIYGKNPLKIFSDDLGTRYVTHWAYQVCSNGNSRLTLTYLTPKSNLLPSAFNMIKF